MDRVSAAVAEAVADSPAADLAAVVAAVSSFQSHERSVRSAYSVGLIP